MDQLLFQAYFAGSLAGFDQAVNLYEKLLEDGALPYETHGELKTVLDTYNAALPEICPDPEALANRLTNYMNRAYETLPSWTPIVVNGGKQI